MRVPAVAAWLAMITLAMVATSRAAHAVQPSFCYQDASGGPPAVRPYASTRTAKTGASLTWPDKRATFRIHREGTADIAGEQEFTVIRRSFATWAAASGAGFDFFDAGFTDSRQVGFDFLHVANNENIVIFQKEWAHEPEKIALTTTSFNALTGELFDADIELNNQNYTFTIDDTNVETDLQNTLTHEIGHFIGFSHPETDPDIPIECASQATMYGVSWLGDVSKRVLAPTDQLGMAFVYPADQAHAQYVYAPDLKATKMPHITQIGSSLNGCRQSHAGAAPLAVLAFALTRRRRRTAPLRRSTGA